MREQLERELLDALVEWGVQSQEELQPQSSLIAGGVLDSVALYNLSLWIEEKIGQPLDPASFDLATEWDSAQRVAAFIERARGGAASASPSAAPARAAAPVVRTDLVAGYDIVPYEPRFKDAVASLQRRLWTNDVARNRAFFEWRYEQNPHASDPIIFLALKQGELVAMRALCGSMWEAGEERTPRLCYLSDDLVVLPGHESHGLFAAFSQLIRETLAARQQDFFLSLSALRVTRLQSIAGGARVVGAMAPHGRSPALVQGLDLLRRGAEKLPVVWRSAKLLTTGERSSSVFSRLTGNSPMQRAGYQIRIADEVRPRQMAQLAAATANDGRIREVRSEQYLQWRFRNPLHEYRFVFAEDAAGLAGYLVLERSRSELANQRRVHIADWEAKSPAALDCLLSAVLDCGRPAEIVIWTATLGPERQALLKQHGFAPTDLEQATRGLPSVLVWPVDAGAEAARLQLGGRSLLDLANWDLRMLSTSLT